MTTTTLSPVELFMQKNNIVKRCQAKAKEMAALELAAWDEKHESELLQFHGYNKKTLAARKIELTKTANS